MNVKNQMRKKDKYCTEFVAKQIASVKNFFGIPKSKRVFALDNWCDRYDFFLCGDNVYAVYFEYKDKDVPIVDYAYKITLKGGNLSEFEIIKPDDTTPKSMTLGNLKIDKTRKIFSEEEFLLWYESPVQVNEFVNVSHKKAIAFLQNYGRITFKTDRYLFYVKRDNDLTWLYFIYAYDLRTKTEVKIYVDDYIDTKFPEKLNEIYVKDLSGKLSDYQRLQCKKEFFRYCKQECKELNAPNFYALEFVKQCIQPIEKDRGWWITKPLCNFDYAEIWIDDYLMYDEKPYFLLRKNDKTQIAVLDFFKPEYKSKEPYVQGYTKRLHWELDRTLLEKFTEFLNAKFDYRNSEWYKRFGGDFSCYKDHTNWQMIIEEYNRNNGSSYSELPLDLPIPDYTKLAQM